MSQENVALHYARGQQDPAKRRRSRWAAQRLAAAALVRPLHTPKLEATGARARCGPRCLYWRRSTLTTRPSAGPWWDKSNNISAGSTPLQPRRLRDAPNLPVEKVTAEIWRRCVDTNLPPRASRRRRPGRSLRAAGGRDRQCLIHGLGRSVPKLCHLRRQGGPEHVHAAPPRRARRSASRPWPSPPARWRHPCSVA